MTLAAILSVGVLLPTFSHAAPRATKKPHPAAAKKTNIPQVNLINLHIRAAWQENKITPSPRATDGEWCRRVFLDIIGRVPSVDELKKFLDSDSDDRKGQLVTRLLSNAYQDQYARNWSTLWTNILIGRNGGTERRSLTSREGMMQYVRESFYSNKPYDRMVHELITAKGINKPGKPGFNGAVNFLTMKLSENAAQATAKTSQIFLGIQVQCTQCHNHPFNEWKQSQFWEMNAFFRQTAVLRRFKERDIDYVELTNQDFAGEDLDKDPSNAGIYYKLRSGKLAVAYPTFVDGTPLASRSGYVNDVNRRDQLAKLIVASPLMDKAIVNRIWGHFLGYGFTKPVDDMGPHNGVSHPDLLNELAAEFRKAKFDLKKLMLWITLSEPYGLSSRTTEANQGDDPLLGETPQFTHFYLRQMRAEELYESLLVATQADQTTADAKKRKAEKQKWLKQFVIAFGTDEGDATTTFNGSIPQTLMMMNGGLIKNATSDKKGGFLHRIAHDSKLTAEDKINRIYLAAVARKPTPLEIQGANYLLRARGGDTTAALQDVFWAVLNSNEFIINH
ncbi:MAG: DUF1549 domain-containing protein [Planctomycetes bacterium]|nr:DUF1549 domain-containing protein [Planctomycetota bacterium]